MPIKSAWTTPRAVKKKTRDHRHPSLSPIAITCDLNPRRTQHTGWPPARRRAVVRHQNASDTCIISGPFPTTWSAVVSDNERLKWSYPARGEHAPELCYVILSNWRSGRIRQNGDCASFFFFFLTMV